MRVTTNSGAPLATVKVQIADNRNVSAKETKDRGSFRPNLVILGALGLARGKNRRFLCLMECRSHLSDRRIIYGNTEQVPQV